MAEKQVLKIFVTGGGQGAGLAAVAEAVRRGHKVVAATDEGTLGATRIRQAGGLPVYPDLTRESALYSALMMAQADYIINAAPQALNGIPQYIYDYPAKIAWLKAATEALLGAAGRANINRIVHLSAAIVYGDTHHHAASEETESHTHNSLAEAFKDSEEAVFDGGIPAYVLRTGYIFGSHHACSEVAKLMRQGKGIPTGHQHTSWIHEDDIATAALAIVEKESDAGVAHAFNLASEEHLSPAEFMKKFGDAFGSGQPNVLGGVGLHFGTSEAQREIMEMGTLMDCSKAASELGWKSKVSIDAGIDRMLLRWRAEEAPSTDSPKHLTGKELVKA